MTMDAALVAVAVLVALLVAAALVWRAASRRRHVPCPAWLEWMMENRYMERAAGEGVLRALDLRPGLDVLDAGCGGGRLTLPVADRVAPSTVVALDAQADMLDLVRRRAAERGLVNVRLVQARLGADPVPGTYDRIALVAVLGEIPDPDRALADLHRVLRPGGRLVVAEVFPDPHFQSRATVRRRLETAGFAVAAVDGNALMHTTTASLPDPGPVPGRPTP